PYFFWWLTPVLVGLICGVWLTDWTSRTSAGRIARRWGLLLIPEETAPPRELAALRCANLDALPASAGSSPSGAGGATACRTGVDARRPTPLQHTQLRGARQPRPGRQATGFCCCSASFWIR